MNKIDICAMQETDITTGNDTNTLSFKGYELITENNNVKMRTGLYKKNDIKYTRMCDLEGINK